VIAAFLCSALLAGGNGVGIRFSNRELDPVWGAGLRFVLAAGLMWLLVAALRLSLPRGQALAGSAVFGLLNFAGAFALAYVALVELHAGFGQILLALVPLVTLLLAVLERQERLRAMAVAGTLIALAGVALMSETSLHDSVPLLSLLAVGGSILCIAQAAVLVRWLPPVHPVAMNAVGMSAGAVVLVLVSGLLGESFELPGLGETWLAVGYTVAAGSVAVFILYLFVLEHWAASRAAYVFVLIPFVTVALSAWLDDEPVGTGLVIGGLLVLAGVYLGALRGTPEP
jgi:drug/metabolite transporter (DMT)-like permease